MAIIANTRNTDQTQTMKTIWSYTNTYNFYGMIWITQEMLPEGFKIFMDSQ